MKKKTVKILGLVGLLVFFLLIILGRGPLISAVRKFAFNLSGQNSNLPNLESKESVFLREPFLDQDMVFPVDGGAHRDKPIEWWYLAANLSGQDKKFNLAMCLFKNGASFFKLTDLVEKKTYYQKFTILPADNFSASKLDIRFGDNYFSESEPFKYALRFKNQEIDLDLKLNSTKKPLTIYNNTDAFYYSQTRVEATVRVGLPDGTYQISGLAWTDREGFSYRISSQVGWRWVFSQLDNQTEFMWLNFFKPDSPEKALRMLLVYDQEEKRAVFRPGDFLWQDLSYWDEKKYGTRYPVKTRLEIPVLKASLDLNIDTADQRLELLGGIYEAGGTVSGSFGSSSVQGYLQQEFVRN